jgi:hypothetical protein
MLSFILDGTSSTLRKSKFISSAIQLTVTWANCPFPAPQDKPRGSADDFAGYMYFSAAKQENQLPHVPLQRKK